MCGDPLAAWAGADERFHIPGDEVLMISSRVKRFWEDLSLLREEGGGGINEDS